MLISSALFLESYFSFLFFFAFSVNFRVWFSMDQESPGMSGMVNPPTSPQSAPSETTSTEEEQQLETTNTQESTNTQTNQQPTTSKKAPNTAGVFGSLLFILLFLWFVYVACGVFLFVFQERVVFPGSWLPDQQNNQVDVQIITYSEINEKMENITFRMFYAVPKTLLHDDVILFFGGNAEMEQSLRFRARAFSDYGYRSLAVEYPGYGETPGSPGIHSFYQVADSAGRYANSLINSPSAHVLAVGSSLGTFSALRIQAEGYAEKSLLHAPFPSLVELAQNLYWFYPTKYLLKDDYKFDNSNALKTIRKSGTCSKTKKTVLIIHGDADSIVPQTFGEQVAVGLRKCAHFVSATGCSHNNVPLTKGGTYGLEIASFFEE